MLTAVACCYFFCTNQLLISAQLEREKQRVIRRPADKHPSARAFVREQRAAMRAAKANGDNPVCDDHATISLVSEGSASTNKDESDGAASVDHQAQAQAKVSNATKAPNAGDGDADDHTDVVTWRYVEKMASALDAQLQLARSERDAAGTERDELLQKLLAMTDSYDELLDSKESEVCCSFHSNIFLVYG